MRRRKLHHHIVLGAAHVASSRHNDTSVFICGDFKLGFLLFVFLSIHIMLIKSECNLNCCNLRTMSASDIVPRNIPPKIAHYFITKDTVVDFHELLCQCILLIPLKNLRTFRLSWGRVILSTPERASDDLTGSSPSSPLTASESRAILHQFQNLCTLVDRRCIHFIASPFCLECS